MSAYALGRLARVFESLGSIDKPEEGNVTYLPILQGLLTVDYDSRMPETISPLMDEISIDEANRITPLDEAEERAFWEGWRTQTPIKRPGRPRGDGKRRNLMITDDDMLQLRIAGKGNASEGLRRIIADYTRLPGDSVFDLVEEAAP